MASPSKATGGKPVPLGGGKGTSPDGSNRPSPGKPKPQSSGVPWPPLNTPLPGQGGLPSGSR